MAEPDVLRVTAVIESREGFAFAACCWYLHRMDPASEALLTVLNARDKHRKVLFLAQSDSSSVWFRGQLLDYAVETSGPLSTDGRPEPFRRLRLRGQRKAVCDLVDAALDSYRKHLALRGVGDEDGVPCWSWDEESGCWSRGRGKRTRPMHTLFLQPEAQALIDDFRHFGSADAAARYHALHVAPTRVYMLHGVPGSGKSSLVHCVASDASMGIATLSFTPTTTDSDVRSALACVPARCVVCIEDVDCLFSERRSSGAFTFAGMLAALDAAGDAATEPLAVFLTTNKLATLDPALRRRIDYVLEFKHATRDQAAAMFAQYFPQGDFEAVWAGVRGTPFSMSVFQKFLLKALSCGNPLACLPQFRELASTAADSQQQPSLMYS